MISIDGPAASGKSTIARALAGHLGYRHISSGNLYRLFALAAMRKGVDPTSAPEIEALLAGTEPGVDSAAERYLLDGEDVTDALSSPEVSDFTSRIATLAPVRERVNRLLRQWCEDRDTVVEGRDIGTVVFPDARLKVFLTASLEERARRRFDEFRRKTGATTIERVMAELRTRDDRDGSRSLAPLTEAEDAVRIDSTGKPIDAVVREIASILG